MLYRQLAHKLRIQGRKPLETSERPRDTTSRHYLDEPCATPNHHHPTDQEPTLVELGPNDPVDVAWLLRIGAIAPYSPPRPKKEAAGG